MASGRYPRLRESPHPPPPSRSNTTRIISTVVISIFHLFAIQSSADGQYSAGWGPKPKCTAREETLVSREARKLLCASPAVHKARSAKGQTTTKRRNGPARCPDRPLGKWRYMVTVTWYGHKAGTLCRRASTRTKRLPLWKFCRSYLGYRSQGRIPTSHVYAEILTIVRDLANKSPCQSSRKACLSTDWLQDVNQPKSARDR